MKLVSLLHLCIAMALWPLTACTNDTASEGTLLKPPLKPGQMLDPDSLYAKTWPGKPTLVKLKDNLILAIPPQHSQFWAQRHWITGRDRAIRPPYPLEKLPTTSLAGFVMFMPDFRGYTPDNYLKDFDEDRIVVTHIGPAPMSSMEPDAPGYFAPNGLARFTKSGIIPDASKYEVKSGLNCYIQSPSDGDHQICFGQRDQLHNEQLLLHVTVPPFNPSTVFPLMKTKYFSSRYGGLEVGWRANMKHFDRWREIDEQIWKYIDAWNVAPQTPKN